MLFNSIEFGLFFPLVFITYWIIFRNNNKLRNFFLLAVSYFFYGVWDSRFLILIVVSSLADYVFGIQIHESNSPKKKKLFLTFSLIVNLGILGFFKYFNFFTQSFVDVFKIFGQEINITTLQFILPVGISFYTFQTLSYTLDIYNKKLEPTKDIIAFFAFVSFFPQLVAGPIERAKDLLPQFQLPKTPNYSKIKSGLFDIATGLFKKVVIADRLAIYVDGVYGDLENAQGLPILIGTLFFAFQLYLDFSAYSQIAIGAAKMLDFDLSTNFRRPYLSNSFAGFWSRWHITLSSWFRDYVYIPLGGNRRSKLITNRNVLIVFLLSGLWHGASWNFVIWGGLNGLYQIFLDKWIVKNLKLKPLKQIFVVAGWTLSLVFFRASTFADSLMAFKNIGFSFSENLYNFGLNKWEYNLSIALLIVVMVTEIISEKGINIKTWIGSKALVLRYSFYVALIMVIVFLGSYGVGLNDNNFIYFQF